MKFFRTILTDDSDAWELNRVMAFAACILGFALQTYAVVWKGAAFSLSEYGIGYGAMFLALAGAAKLQQPRA